MERSHKTIEEELLNDVAPFESLPAAQAAIDAWRHIYNQRSYSR